MAWPIIFSLCTDTLQCFVCMDLPMLYESHFVFGLHPESQSVGLDVEPHDARLHTSNLKRRYVQGCLVQVYQMALSFAASMPSRSTNCQAALHSHHGQNCHLVVDLVEACHAILVATYHKQGGVLIQFLHVTCSSMHMCVVIGMQAPLQAVFQELC
jgi:hypothetical protein